MEDILREFSRLKRAVIDSSSVIYAENSGFFHVLRGAVDLVTTEGVLSETGLAAEVLRVENPLPASGGGRKTVDDTVAELARFLAVPLISEDRKLLVRFGESGLPFYNSLMMLHFLLYRGFLTVTPHEEYLNKLIDIARYNQKVLSFGDVLYMEILKRV